MSANDKDIVGKMVTSGVQYHCKKKEKLTEKQ